MKNQFWLQVLLVMQCCIFSFTEQYCSYWKGKEHFWNVVQGSNTLKPTNEELACMLADPDTGQSPCSLEKLTIDLVVKTRQNVMKELDEINITRYLISDHIRIIHCWINMQQQESLRSRQAQKKYKKKFNEISNQLAKFMTDPDTGQSPCSINKLSKDLVEDVLDQANTCDDQLFKQRGDLLKKLAQMRLWIGERK